MSVDRSPTMLTRERSMHSHELSVPASLTDVLDEL